MPAKTTATPRRGEIVVGDPVKLAREKAAGHRHCVLTFAPPCRKRLFDCTRGDTTVKVGSLTTNIWDAIMQAGLVIADVSIGNVNVFYELGLTHALGKDTLLLKQKAARLPADFGGAHYFEYELGRLDEGRAALQAEVEKWAARSKAAQIKALYHP